MFCSPKETTVNNGTFALLESFCPLFRTYGLFENRLVKIKKYVFLWGFFRFFWEREKKENILGRCIPTHKYESLLVGWGWKRGGWGWGGMGKELWTYLGSIRVKSALPMVWKGFMLPTLARTFFAPLLLLPIHQSNPKSLNKSINQSITSLREI